MAKRASYDKDEILADWKTGKNSVRSLANKHRVSHGTVHTLVKGVEHSLAPLIDAEVAIKQELANLSRQELDKFTHEVDERTKHIKFFSDVTIKNLSIMAKKITDETTIVDHKAAQEAILKGRETVLGKEPSSSVTINNQNNQQSVVQVSDDDLIRIATTGR